MKTGEKQKAKSRHLHGKSAESLKKPAQVKLFVPEGFPKPTGKLGEKPVGEPAGKKAGKKAGNKSRTQPKFKKEAAPPRARKKPPITKKGRKGQGPSRRRSESILPWVFRLPWPVCIIVIATVLLAVNFAYQVLHKPTEIVGIFESRFQKTPSETWRTYGETFKAKATSIMTPDLLAALAQVESSGNPIVRTSWRWHWSSDVTKIFAPASSAVGIFQITEGTFREAKHFCVKDGQAYQDGPQGNFCLGSFSYSRLVPAHAIEMTSARLHLVAERLLHRSNRHARWALSDKQNIAIVTHLCGAAKAGELVHSGMRLSELGKCGDHNPVVYLHQIRRLQTQFRLLQGARAQLASLEVE